MHEKKLRKIRRVLIWHAKQFCPKCGWDIKIDGKYSGCNSEWYGVSENDAFEYCTKCDFKHYMYSYRDRLPDDLYLDSIRKIMDE